MTATCVIPQGDPEWGTSVPDLSSRFHEALSDVTGCKVEGYTVTEECIVNYRSGTYSYTNALMRTSIPGFVDLGLAD